MKSKLTVIGVILLMFIALSCLRSIEDYEMEEAAKMQKYLDENSSLNFEKKSSGLYYLELVTGTGLSATSDDSAFVFYNSYLLDGTELDSNTGTTDTLVFPLNENYVIEGFDEGVSYMKVGGKSMFLIPSKLGYGSTGNYYNIGGYTPLLFTVQLVRLKSKSAGK
jgi:peptidyl-prolyl cis-trans isomerase A (cyclophilin A)